MIWSVEITRGENGYKLGYWEETEDGYEMGWREEYIQDEERDGLKSGEELLWYIINYFSLSGSKHDPERLRIIRENKEE